MNTDAIREAVLRRPFLPFTLRLNDGRVFFVPYPEFVAVSKRVVFVIKPDTEAGLYLEPLLIASLEYEPSQQGPTSPNPS
jgi:hypothetical protein